MFNSLSCLFPFGRAPLIGRLVCWVCVMPMLSGCLEKTGNTTNINRVNKCGDLVVGGAEKCDDGNNDSGDGCSKDCKQIEDGYQCPADGGECKWNTCCVAGEQQGCSDEGIESCVCDIDEYCCSGSWLASCAKLAIDECAAECRKEISDCKTPAPYPNCKDPDVAACVCTGDNEVCCSDFWDESCVFAAVEMCGVDG